MGNSESGNAYVLISKDGLSGYVWLKPCESSHAETASKILMEWAAAFGIPMAWMSDQGSHFKKKILSALSKKLRIDHRFSLPYFPWVNGTVEVVCREMARATRAILSNLQLPKTDCPSVVPIVKTALNISSTKVLNGKCPMNVFTGMKPDNPIDAILRKENGLINVSDIEVERRKSLIDT